MRRMNLLGLTLGVAGSAIAAAAPAQALEYPWCAQYSQRDLSFTRYAMATPSAADDGGRVAGMPRLAQGGGSGGRNCGFMTLEQCRAAVSGTGGFCEPNPFYKGPEPVPSRRHRR